MEKDYYLAFGEADDCEEEREKEKENATAEATNLNEKRCDEFESDMDAELDVAFSDRQNSWIPGTAKLSNSLEQQIKKKRRRGEDADEEFEIDDHDTESDEGKTLVEEGRRW